jgi:hypothetical protein
MARRGAGLGFLVVAALGLGLIPAAQAAASPAARAAASPVAADVSTAACNGVLFIGARGSGEFGPGSDGWPRGRTKADHYGLGGEVNDVYNRIKSDLSGTGLSLDAPVSIGYHADRVQTLLRLDFSKYFGDLAAGVAAAKASLTGHAKACPHQPVVLAGFSQGAMVMHRVLHDLGGTTSGRAILARIAAAVLIGDGDQVPGDREVRFGSAAGNARGIGQADRDSSHSSLAKFTASVGSRVLRVCNAHDIVCGWTNANILKCLTLGKLYCAASLAVMVHIHLSYGNSKPLLAAADQAARNVLVGRWSRPGNIAGGNGLNSVSCPTTSFCLAIDTGGDVYSYVRGTWSAPRQIDSSASLIQVSCATTSFCAAITSGATAYIDSNGTWSASQLTGTGDNPANLTAVSCPVAGFCLATGEYDAYTYSAGTWSTGVQVQDTNVFTAIACHTSGFCVAADDDGQVYTYSSGKWSAARTLDSGAYLSSVSCPAARFCVATTSGTTAYSWNGSRWSGYTLTASDGNTANLTSVSCPAAGFCWATGDFDGYLYLAAWARGIVIQDYNNLTSISCPARSFCVAVDTSGNAFTYG